MTLEVRAISAAKTDVDADADADADSAAELSNLGQKRPGKLIDSRPNQY